MKPMEHDAKSTSTSKTGLFAMLRGLLGHQGRGAPRVRRKAPFFTLSLAALSISLCAPGSATAAERLPKLPYSECVGVSHTTMELKGDIQEFEEAKDQPVKWAFEYSSSAEGPWTPVPGASGTITQAEMEASPLGSGGSFAMVTAAFTGLTPEVPYYVRLTASNPLGAATAPLETIESTGGKLDYMCEALPFHPIQLHVYSQNANPTATTTHVEGSFKPLGAEVHWHFEYATSENGAFHVAPDASGTVAAGEENEAGFSFVSGELSGLSPATVYYVRLFAESEPEPGVHEGATSSVESLETVGPPAATAYVVHSVSGEDLVALGAIDPHGADSHYHFEYVSQQHFEEQGFAGAATTSEVDVAAGQGYAGAGGDLPGLQPGVTYHYRLFASNEAARQGVHSGEQTLTVPVRPEVGAGEGCPNESLRIGPSAALPDCRAYEQITPVEKNGAMDIDTPSGATDEFRVSEDGEQFMLHAPGTQWGASPDASKSNYFFSRTSDGWQMISATPQPQAGIDSTVPVVFSPDLTETGVETGWLDSPVSSSPMVEIQVGPSGGPYASIASIPRKYVTASPLLVAASPDLRKVIIGTEDRGLVPGRVSATKSGNDLYEHSEGQLRQVNVLSGIPGGSIGTCGAGMAKGIEGLAIRPETIGGQPTSSAHSVSADGSRVFFYAVPGGHCPTQKELERELVEGGPHALLYERLNGAETIDIGEYKFLAANPQGSSLLLEHVNGEGHEAFLYDTETQTAEHLFTAPAQFAAKISADFSTIYISTGAALTPEGQAGTGHESLYRYDVSSKTLHYLPLSISNEAVNVSANGRYLVFEGSSQGFPGIPGGVPREEINGQVYTGDGQIYRYDSSENVIECISCASPFDPQPKFESNALYAIYGWDGTPNQVFASENGDFVFFETPDALVPEDTNGESAPDDKGDSELIEDHRSLSNDVYEWRGEGVDGCVVVEGCLALISGGRGGGYLTELVGATPSGRDVFFATHESLVPGDKDTAGDVYDARIGGGFPPPAPGPVECEGDACATPVGAPVDSTPSSFTFSGAGNVAQSSPAGGKPVVTSTKHPKKTNKNKKKGKRKKAKAKKSARRSSDSRRGK